MEIHGQQHAADEFHLMSHKTTNAESNYSRRFAFAWALAKIQLTEKATHAQPSLKRLSFLRSP
jgi:hypothetical protein